jgi:hypothetical protein
MKISKILVAALAVSLFGAIFAGVTCGGVFNWVYKLEPTNVWKPMVGPPGLNFYIGEFLFSVIFVVVYALLRKGLVFGLCVWAVGILPGMFATYFFMTVATGVVIYWTVLGLVATPIKGLIVAVLYGE